MTNVTIPEGKMTGAEVLQAIGYTSSGLYGLIRKGKLPKGRKLAFSHTKVWDKSVIEAFIASREGT